MSTELYEIEALRGKLQITQFAGPVKVGPMLQLTQGIAGSIIGQPDDLGAIQLTLGETAALVPKLVAWMRDESRRRAEILRKKIAEDKSLEKTIFNEAAECERFISEFEIPALCVSMLAMNTPKDSTAERTPGSLAGVESEVCEYCEGVSSISYNPNLNPNAFPATAIAKCTHCHGTGRVEKAKPQPNQIKMIEKIVAASQCLDTLLTKLQTEVIATNARPMMATHETNWGKSERLEGRKDGLFIAIDLLREVSALTDPAAKTQ